MAEPVVITVSAQKAVVLAGFVYEPKITSTVLEQPVIQADVVSEQVFNIGEVEVI